MIVIVLLIILIISIFNIKVRSFVCFNLVAIGIGALIAGIFAKDGFLCSLGGGLLAIGLLYCYITTLKLEKSSRAYYMRCFLIYGLLIFVKIMMISLIITIPFLSFINAAMDNYHEAIIVDSNGREVRRTYVNNCLKDMTGNYYDPYDPY